MIHEKQLAEIRNYLLTKKLPIDILLEVQDHFIAQISDLQRDEDIDFDAAFAQVKEKWRTELMPYWKGEMNLEDTSDLVRKITKEINRSNLKEALQWGWIPVIIIVASAYLMNATAFGIFALSVLLALLLFTTVNYFRHYSAFKIFKKYPNHILTLHQHSVIIFFLVLGPFISIFGNFFENAEKIQHLLLFKGSMFQFLMMLLPFAIVSCSCFYSLSAQKSYLRQIEKVKPFLQYL